MEKTELRIGQTVFVDNSENPCTIKELRENHARLDYIREDTGKPHCSLVEYERITLGKSPLVKANNMREDLEKIILSKVIKERTEEQIKCGSYEILEGGIIELAKDLEALKLQEETYQVRDGNYKKEYGNGSLKAFFKPPVQETKESEDELWNDVFKIMRTHRHSIFIIKELKTKFKITKL